MCVYSTWLEDLSPQQLISCDYSQLGCGGGNVITALQYTTSNALGGVTNWNTVPFTDFDGDTSDECPAEIMPGGPLSVVVPRMAMAVSSTSPSDPTARLNRMKAALAKQPLVVLMDATCLTFQSYSSGIIDDDGQCACADGSCIDHAVLMVRLAWTWGLDELPTYANASHPLCSYRLDTTTRATHPA